METLLVETIGDQIILLKVNRPSVLNALNQKALQEMLHFFQSQAYSSKVRCLIFTGAGDKSFIAGADIKEMQAMSQEDLKVFCQLGQDVTMAFAKAPFPIIAAVNGYALGAGLEMALAADFIYASHKAKFGLPEVSLGVIPAFGGTQRLARAIGIRLAKELIMSGRLIDANKAYALGLVNQLCEPEKLITECLLTAKEIIKHSPYAVLQAKRSIDIGSALSLSDSLELEKNMSLQTFHTKECQVSMKAFLERKKG